MNKKLPKMIFALVVLAALFVLFVATDWGATIIGAFMGSVFDV